MELINNTTKTLKDDLSVEIKQGRKLSVHCGGLLLHYRTSKGGDE